MDVEKRALAAELTDGGDRIDALPPKVRRVEIGANVIAVGPNAVAASKSWSAEGHYTVRCEVSDMRGGTRSALLAVTVGWLDGFFAFLVALAVMLYTWGPRDLDLDVNAIIGAGGLDAKEAAAKAMLSAAE